MAFYALLKVRALNVPKLTSAQRGDIISVMPFDDWEQRPKGGPAVRKHSLLMYLQLPDAARNKIERLTVRRFNENIFEDGIDTVDYVMLGKRRLSIPWQMIRDRFPVLWANVQWSRVLDPDDGYQPWVNGDASDRVFNLTSSMANFIRDKWRDSNASDENEFHYMTDQELTDALTD